MQGPETVTLGIADGIARIVLADPDNRNAVTARSSAAFLAAAQQAVSAPEVRVIVLSGTGDFFCVGGHIGEFISTDVGLPAHIATLTDNIHGGIRHLVRSSIPVVVGLNGMVAGGGVGIMLTGDVIVAKRSARVNSGYTRSALTPDAGLTWHLPRLIGHARAFEVVAFNEFISAQQALEFGLVSRVVDDEAFEAELEAVVESLNRSVGTVLGDPKRLLRQAAGETLEAQLHAEAAVIAARVALPETVEKLAAFASRQSAKGQR